MNITRFKLVKRLGQFMYKRLVASYKADHVWAAACAAQRINNEYVKISAVMTDSTSNKRANIRLMDDFLDKPHNLTEADIENGKKIRAYYQAFTFKILKNIKLNEFDHNAMTIASRDDIVSNYQISVICSLPSCYERAVKHDMVQNRIDFANGGVISTVGSKVKVENLEVLKCFYSIKYDTSFVSAITPNDQVILFAYDKNIEVGTIINIQGTVKAHLDKSTTKLNRVKILS